MQIRQQLTLHQKLAMTPQLQQAIRLLQLSRGELLEEMHKALDENPILMREEESQAPSLEDRPSPLSDATQEPPPHEEPRIDWDTFLAHRNAEPRLQEPRGGLHEFPTEEQAMPTREGLVEHLREQIPFAKLTEDETRFAELVLGNLDDNGLLDLHGVEREDGTCTQELTVDDLARDAGLDPEDAAEVLALMQRWDPVGCCTHTLHESLLVQAEMFGDGALEQTLLKEHLPLLEKHAYAALARTLHLPLESVLDAVQNLQKLSLHPGAPFSASEEGNFSLVPDVYVTQQEGGWKVSEHERGVPCLRINPRITQQLLQNPTARPFVEEKLRHAHWFLRVIEQRRKTIVRVAQCIVEEQQEFFERGVAYLKPMGLRDVADRLSLHPSTISRVTTQKYMHTPHGIYELKYFFNAAISRFAAEDIASESVKEAVRSLIAQEDKTHPLSDQELADRLHADAQIVVARRTVAKYREGLGIPPSTHRKRVAQSTR